MKPSPPIASQQAAIADWRAKLACSDLQWLDRPIDDEYQAIDNDRLPKSKRATDADDLDQTLRKDRRAYRRSRSWTEVVYVHPTKRTWIEEKSKPFRTVVRREERVTAMLEKAQEIFAERVRINRSCEVALAAQERLDSDRHERFRKRAARALAGYGFATADGGYVHDSSKYATRALAAIDVRKLRRELLERGHTSEDFVREVDPKYLSDLTRKCK